VTPSPRLRLEAIKLAHTVIWAFFAACILAVPWYTWTGRFGRAFGLIAIVTVEVVILVLNRWRCPLTDVAARYTEKRRDNFDIYLPLWLARHNKTIFGILFVGGVIFTLGRWLQTRS